MKLKIDQYDGFLDLEIKPNGTYLIVYAPVEGGKRVTLEEAINFLKQREVEKYNLEAVKEALNSTKEREEKLISVTAFNEIKDEELIIEVSKNKIFAVISFVQPQSGGKILTKDDIIQRLNKKGIVNGIDVAGIDKILADKKYNFKYIIAKGTEVVNGKNGVLNFYFDVQKKMIKPKISDDGTIDFKNLDLIEIVKKGQVLVTRTPPKIGNPGKDVFGKVIPNVVGKEAILPQGKNVLVSEDGNSLIAEIDGQISYLNNKISIHSTYEVPANVDNSTGNIDFVGNVIVKGNVLTGFSIRAGGNIEVQGVVEGATLIAEDNIILYRGMQGINRGSLKAGGNITAKYIENSIIEAGGDIQSNAIMHSTIKAGGFISLEGRKGLLVGGVIRSGLGIDAKTIGSPMATVTEIEVGIDPNIIERYKTLKEEVESLETEQKKAIQLVNSLIQMQSKGKLPEDKEQMLTKYTRTQSFLKSKLETNKVELAELELKIQDRNDGRVKARNVIYPGVKITIGSVFTYVREERKYCCAIVDNAEVKFNSYA